jgi:hypothetical protein
MGESKEKKTKRKKQIINGQPYIVINVKVKPYLDKNGNRKVYKKFYGKTLKECYAKRDKFNALLNLAEVKGNPTLVEFIEHELELLDRKNSADKKPTATQVANDGIKTAILEGMEDGRIYTITDMIKDIPACADLTNQKVSALVRQMMPDLIERVEDKRKSYFRKVEA